ncbi:MAG: hypothetical protein AAF297_02110 [Planctomycetota bacterium]
MKLTNNGSQDRGSLETIGHDRGGSRGYIGLRWHIDARNTLRVGWPDPVGAHEAVALGWVAEDRAIGVIEAPRSGLSDDQLDILDARFPGRRWFAGEWDAPPQTRAAA